MKPTAMAPVRAIRGQKRCAAQREQHGPLWRFRQKRTDTADAGHDQLRIGSALEEHKPQDMFTPQPLTQNK